MRSIGTKLIHGALAGALGAACMTALRMTAHRLGWIDAMVPQAVEVWAHERTRGLRPRELAPHHVADQLLHLGYGAATAALYAATAGRQRATAARALGFGSAVWAFSTMVLLPGLKIARPLWRASPRDELVNLSAHALYAAVSVYLLDEFERQRLTQPRTSRGMRRAAVG